MIFCTLKKNGKVPQKQSTCSWEQFDENFCLKVSCFSIVFGHLEIIFRPFAQCLSKPLSQLLFSCPKGYFGEIDFWKKTVFLYLQWAKNFWQFVAKCFSVVWKTTFYVSKGTIWVRLYLLFWKKFCFSFRFRASRLFLQLQAKQFGSDVKNALYVSIENFCGKTLFSVEKIRFFYHSRILGHFSAIIPYFWRNRQNCIPSVDMHFEDFFKNVFSLFLGMEQKDLVFCRRNSGRVVKLHSAVHRIFLRRNLFFGKK